MAAAALAALVLAGCGDGGPGSAGSAVSAGPAGSPGSAGSVVPSSPASPVVPVSPAGPDTPVGTQVPPEVGDANPQPRAARVNVVPGAVDLRPRPFDSAGPAGERQVAVRFWGGVAPCSVIGRVDVAETPERVTVTLFGGRDPAPGRVACIEVAVYQEVVVDLAAPVGGRAIVDGAG